MRIKPLSDKRNFKRNRTSFKSQKSLKHLGPKVITDEKELKEVKPYLELIRRYIESENITNIAVTGPYGSGKSTILKTFQEWYNPYKRKKDKYYLNISLASFKKKKNDQKKDNEHAFDFDKKVELSILQQMFYQVESKKLPASRFKRINNIRRRDLLVLTIFIILWLIALLVILEADFLERTPLKSFIENSGSNLILIFWAIVFIGIYFIIKKICFLFTNTRIYKMNIKGEVELGDMKESVFNQYLEEILYFFERTKYKVVIIEDIDRFGDTQLFSKLREVNTLINSSKTVGRQIKFIYAVKDDMFQERIERTKFFDSIVPIIPYVNPHNASEQFKNLIGTNINFSETFLEDITGFIGDVDMRLIINVFNEFDLYRKIIPVPKLDCLMAIILYKNLYPQDFSDLHQDKGKLYNLLSKKEQYKKMLFENIEKEKKKIDDKIINIETEWCENIQELRKIYLFSLISKLKNFHSFNMGFERIEDALSNENFKFIRTEKQIRYKMLSSNPSYYGEKIEDKSTENLFPEIEKEISNLSYVQREDNIRSKTNGDLERLKKYKFKISEKQSKINLLNFAELFEEVGRDEDFEIYKSNERFKEIDLIRYFLLNNYIGDDYRDYITLFFDVSITREDHDFIQNIKTGKSISWDYKPSNLKKVTDKIPPRYFSQFHALNFSLFSYCLQEKDSESEKLKLYSEVLALDKEENLRFIMGFVNKKEKEMPAFISQICNTKTNLWIQLYKANLPKEELIKWVTYIFNYANNLEDILRFEELESLSEYLTDQDIFKLAGLMINDKNLTSFLLEKEVKINLLDTPAKKQNNLFKAIYQNHLFQLNFHNIQQIVKHIKSQVEVQALKKSNYTVLRKLNLDSFLKFIEDNISDYIKQVLLSENNKKESEETILVILNNEDVDQELKHKFVLHQDIVLKDLSNVSSLQDKRLVLESNKVTPNWDNIFEYYQDTEESFDDTIVSFLEKNYLELSKFKTETLDDKKVLSKFEKEIIANNELSNNAYSELIKCFSPIDNYSGLDSVDNDKIEILIKQKILSLTKENYQNIKVSEPGLILLFMEAHQQRNDFIEQLDQFDIGDNEIIDIINSDTIEKPQKAQLIESLKNEKIIENSELGKIIFRWLPIDTNIDLSYEVLENLFENNKDSDKKTVLLLNSINKLDEIQLEKLTSLISHEYKKMFIPYQRPKFPETENVLQLIMILDKYNLISSYKIKDQEIFVFPFRKKQF